MQIIDDIPDYTSRPHPFNPYTNNGGTVVAIAGDDYAVIGSDTRLSSGYSIFTRDQKKLFKLSPHTVLGSSGCWCDILSLTRLINTRMKIYEHEHGKPMSTPAAAQMLSTMLYYKRFFPYYTTNIVAGLDAEGKGCVFSFDPIGHCERSKYCACGSAGSELQPLLDNQVAMKNMQNIEEVPCPKNKALALIKDLFISAAERDIYTGDNIDIILVTAKRVKEEQFALRKD